MVKLGPLHRQRNQSTDWATTTTTTTASLLGPVQRRQHLPLWNWSTPAPERQPPQPSGVQRGGLLGGWADGACGLWVGATWILIRVVGERESFFLCSIEVDPGGDSAERHFYLQQRERLLR